MERSFLFRRGQPYPLLGTGCRRAGAVPHHQRTVACVPLFGCSRRGLHRGQRPIGTHSKAGHMGAPPPDREKVTSKSWTAGTVPHMVLPRRIATTPHHINKGPVHIEGYWPEAEYRPHVVTVRPNFHEPVRW